MEDLKWFHQIWRGFKFPQLTSVLIASFSLIITIILSPRTWERKQTFTFCLRLHDDLFLSHTNPHVWQQMYSLSQLPQPNDGIVSQPGLQFCFPCDVLGQMTDVSLQLFFLFQEAAVWAMGSSYPWYSNVTLFSVISNDIKSWHLLASWTVWAQWRKNDALASTEDVSW